MAPPPATTFDQVNDFYKWEAWSPWAKLDPDAKITFERSSLGRRHDPDLGRKQQCRPGQDDADQSQPYETAMYFDAKQFYLSAEGGVNRSQRWLRSILPVFLITLVLVAIDMTSIRPAPRSSERLVHGARGHSVDHQLDALRGHGADGAGVHSAVRCLPAGRDQGQGKAPLPRRHQDLGACPSDCQWRPCLDHPFFGSFLAYAVFDRMALQRRQSAATSRLPRPARPATT